MKATVAMCTAFALATSIAALAQSPQRPSEQTPQTSRQSTAASKITVSGCVQRAQEQRPTGTTGTTTTPGARNAPATKFVLTNASIKEERPAGTTGTTNPPSTAVASEYRLDATDAKLTPHIGHKVEITGMVEQPSATTAQPPAASAANAPTLKVDDVKMVATTCP